MATQEARLRKGEFTLDDFKKMLGQTKKLGPINKIMGMIPGMGGMADMTGRRRRRSRTCADWCGIIDSMTPDERRNPSRVVDQSRRRRIAAGAGVEPHEVNDLVKQFDVMADMMKKMSSMGMRDRMKARCSNSAPAACSIPAPSWQSRRAAPASGSRTKSRPSCKKQREKKLRKRRASGKEKRRRIGNGGAQR